MAKVVQINSLDENSTSDMVKLLRVFTAHLETLQGKSPAAFHLQGDLLSIMRAHSALEVVKPDLPEYHLSPFTECTSYSLLPLLKLLRSRLVPCHVEGPVDASDETVLGPGILEVCGQAGSQGLVS